ncbi:MAG: MBL fold metallo-hydrolase [Bifidobacteriaceae bacterium]|jgi:glyoxylase-like metal-dependent hydrolase (beta-lactamase superfamily II)|nr:MBL fold metallo-hydrolase [Bifidobacteriaceae bacterium]
MYVAGGVSGDFQANWYLVGPDAGTDCVVIDPGQDAAGPVGAALADSGRTPSAILATHGHIDHIADAAALASAFGVPLHIHAADRRFLTDPLAALLPAMAAMFDAIFPGPFVEPDDVREYQFEGARGRLEAGGLAWELRAAPGHTPGCVLLAAGGGSPAPLVFTGDVVFAGAIGRTDFAASDPQAMRRSLRDQVLSLPDAARLLPGHGPVTGMGRERRSNPFLAGLV